MSKVEGAHAVEDGLSKVTHFALYAFMTIMPATGIAMGYYGGRGLPFFYTTIPSAVPTNEQKAQFGSIAKQVSRLKIFFSKNNCLFELDIDFLNVCCFLMSPWSYFFF